MAVVVYLKVPAMISKSLDERAERIRGELDAARRLREEAQQLLAEYQQKRKEAEEEAGEIVEAAKREAEHAGRRGGASAPRNMSRGARRWPSRRSARPNAMPSARCGPAAVDIAVEAARALLAAKVDAAAGADLFRTALQQVRDKLN